MVAVVDRVFQRFEAQSGITDVKVTLDNVRTADHVARQWVAEAMID